MLSRDKNVNIIKLNKMMENKWNLFLDDFRHPYDCIAYMQNKRIYSQLDWTIARNYKEFITLIEERGLPELISFDHDLAQEHYDPIMYDGVEDYSKLYETFEEKTGFECAKWLVDYCMDNSLGLPEFEIHSMNPAGGENIRQYLLNFKKHQGSNNN